MTPNEQRLWDHQAFLIERLTAMCNETNRLTKEMDRISNLPDATDYLDEILVMVAQHRLSTRGAFALFRELRDDFAGGEAATAIFKAARMPGSQHD